MDLYVVRHGESESNAANSHDSRDPAGGDQLTDRGWEQARRLGKRLQRERIAEIVCSPMRRAQETASAISETLDTPILLRDEIHEIIQPDSYYQSLDNKQKYGYPFWMLEDPDRTIEGSESLADVLSRISTFKSFLDGLEKPEKVLAVSHGNFLRLFLLSLIAGQQFSPADMAGFDRLSTTNTGITVFSRSGPQEEWCLTTWMDHAHL